MVTTVNDDTIIVSLTSHSIRLANVAKTTIWSIINSTFKNLHIVITVFKDDLPLMPNDLKLLIKRGFVELIVADKAIGPHTKYFYAMQKYRNNPVITVDDDVIYPETMVQQLVDAMKKYPNTIIARRSFVMVGDKNGIAPYRSWMKHFAGKTQPSHKNFATGIGGVLYPADCLHISDNDLPEILSVKFDDDFFLKAREIRLGLKVANICGTWTELYKKNLDDPKTQSIARWNDNKNGGSDKCIAKYKKEFSDAIK